MAMDEGAWIEDLGGEAPVEGPHWLLDRRATVRLVLASALALAFLFTGYVRFAYGVWTPVESPAVIDGYRLADSAPVALAEVRAWATIHDPGPREPIVLEPVLGRLPSEWPCLGRAARRAAIAGRSLAAGGPGSLSPLRATAGRLTAWKAAGAGSYRVGGGSATC